MDLKRLIEQLRINGGRLQALMTGVTLEQARWRPDPESWSILEVINHLYDEEREDFRVRFSLLLQYPQKPWPPIDPAGWVASRRYNERELEQSIQNFSVERKNSLEWLLTLHEPDFEASAETPWGGRIAAGDLFAAWVAHDTLHMRQLVELHRAYIIRLTTPFCVEYAGPW